MSTLEARIGAIASSQHGVVSLDQLRDLGASVKQVHTSVTRGRWRRIHASVFAVSGAPVSHAQRLTAACLAVGPDATASHRAAAWVWGFDGFDRPGPLEVTFEEGRGPLPQGVIRHRTRRFDPVDRTMHNGIPVTTRERTLIDLGAVARPFLVDIALQSYLRSGGTRTKLDARLDAIGGRGCRGVGTMRRVLRSQLEGRPLASVLEVMFKWLLERHGIERPIAQYEVRLPDGSSVVLDFAWPHYKAAVDVHGFAKHRSRQVFEGDFSRLPELEALGWRYRPYTYKQVAHRESLVIQSLLRAIPELVRNPCR